MTQQCRPPAPAPEAMKDQFSCKICNCTVHLAHFDTLNVFDDGEKVVVFDEWGATVDKDVQACWHCVVIITNYDDFENWFHKYQPPRFGPIQPYGQPPVDNPFKAALKSRINGKFTFSEPD